MSICCSNNNNKVKLHFLFLYFFDKFYFRPINLKYCISIFLKLINFTICHCADVAC